jgi:hypothetical protein
MTAAPILRAARSAPFPLSGTLARVENCRLQFRKDSSMPNTTVASATFPSRKAADQAVHRLVSSGFARNSIDLRRHDEDDGYDLEVHTRRENLARVERLIHSSASMYSVREAAFGAARTARSHPILLLGAGILAGFAIYNLIPRGGNSSQTRQTASRSRRR